MQNWKEKATCILHSPALRNWHPVSFFGRSPHFFHLTFKLEVKSKQSKNAVKLKHVSPRLTLESSGARTVGCQTMLLTMCWLYRGQEGRATRHRTGRTMRSDLLIETTSDFNRLGQLSDGYSRKSHVATNRMPKWELLYLVQGDENSESSADIFSGRG